MSAPSELFVTENLRDMIEGEVRKHWDGEFEIEVPDNWKGIWDILSYPTSGIARILGDDDQVVGTVTWTVKVGVQEGNEGRWLETEITEYSVNIDGERNEEQVIDRLAKWIDTGVIAEMIVDHLKETGETVSFENGRDVWLRELQYMGGNIGGC